MISDQGTSGIVHTIHVAQDDDGELIDFQKYENVLDVMNLPNGSVKFYFEGGEKLVKNGRIVRSKVEGVDEAFRYRCSSCKIQDTDVITQQDRGSSMLLNCMVCETETEHLRRELDDL